MGDGSWLMAEGKRHETEVKKMMQPSEFCGKDVSSHSLLLTFHSNNKGV
jgi:hypothetical protein